MAGSSAVTVPAGGGVFVALTPTLSPVAVAPAAGSAVSAGALVAVSGGSVASAAGVVAVAALPSVLAAAGVLGTAVAVSSAGGAQLARKVVATTRLPVTDAISFSACRREMRP